MNFMNIESFDLELRHLKDSCKKEINNKLRGTGLSLERSDVQITLLVTTKTLVKRVEKLKREYFKEKGLKNWGVKNQ